MTRYESLEEIRDQGKPWWPYVSFSFHRLSIIHREHTFSFLLDQHSAFPAATPRTKIEVESEIGALGYPRRHGTNTKSPKVGF